MAKKKAGTASLREQVKALDEYLTRIGAEELNFRRFMVKEYVSGRNYYIEKTLITIGADGLLYCSRKEHEPTDKERKAIEEGLKTAVFHKSVLVVERAAEKQAEKIGGEVYLFRSRRDGGKISMLQQKFINEAGGKVYVPWTFWSDGEWRKMEPEGKLPFWKPRPIKHTPGLKMIHEGAKAASYVTDLIADPKRIKEHPWGEFLRRYEHWGMIGGALAPHRTEYDELRAETPSEVIYACDNDFLGESALQTVSKNYGGGLLGIKFGKGFPLSWDMADPMPEVFYAGKGEKRRYVGPLLSTLVEPATWATEKVEVGKKGGRPLVIMRQPFLEEWVHSVTPEVFIHRNWANRMLSANEFNNMVRPYSDAEDTKRLFLAAGVSKSTNIKYDPSLESGMYGAREGRFFNTHMPSDVKAEKGDPQPFLDFMQHLVPNERDRRELMRWCATLVARPGTKMTYGVLLISENQGVGKGTLGEHILTPLVGKFNVSFPSEHDIVESQFNQWLAHKRLAVVNEIYAGQSTKAYNRLKSIIADRAVDVNKKHLPQYTIDNWIHIFACSNSIRAIKLDMADRRWFLPRVTETKKPKDYWVTFHDWLRNQGGLGIVRYWADEFLKTTPQIFEGEEAPASEVKTEVIKEGYSDGQALVADTLQEIRQMLSSEDAEDVNRVKEWEAKGMSHEGKVYLLDRDLQRLITEQVHGGKPSDRLERPLTIRRVAKDCQWLVGGEAHQVRIGGTVQRVRIITNDPETAAHGPNGLKPLALDWKKTI